MLHSFSYGRRRQKIKGREGGTVWEHGQGQTRTLISHELHCSICPQGHYAFYFCRSKAANVTISTFHETSCFPDAVLLLQFSLWPTEGAFCSVLACFASPFCVKLKMWSHISSPVLLCLGLCIDHRWDLVSTIDIWQLNDSLPRLLVSLPTSERSVVAWLRQDPINKCVADVSHFKQYLPVDYQKMALDGISHQSDHFFSCWSVGFMS